MTKEYNSRSLVISYLTLRRTIGILGVALPAILAIGYLIAGGDGIRPSISSYYHTPMRDIYVGVLCGVALFLFSYRGYDLQDSITGDLAGLFALGVVFLPASGSLIGTVHEIFAALFFLSLAYFSVFLFTRGKGRPTKAKRRRNRLYRICGFVMVGCTVLATVYTVSTKLQLLYSWLNPLFWLESAVLWAFGISWLTKGEVILRDAMKPRPRLRL
jgi:hypothetical protein